jgi:hypothetical protein
MKFLQFLDQPTTCTITGKPQKEVRFDMHIICEVRTSEEKLKMPILDFR